MKRYAIYMMVFFTALACNSYGQDLHFSQLFQARQLLNPALSGQMDEDARLSLNYRTQWGTVSVPYVSMTAGVESGLLKGNLGKNFFGAGLIIVNDQAGDSELQHLQVMGSLAFHKSLNDLGNHFFSVGFQSAFGQQDLNFSKLLFDNQFNGDVLDPNLGSGENLTRTSFNYFDINAGASWFFTPSAYNSYQIGISVQHLTEPNMSFYDDVSEPLYRKITVHGGAEFPVARGMSLLARGYSISQGKSRETVVGALGRFAIYEDEEDMTQNISLYFGAMHRLGDAIILIGRVDYGPVSGSLSYDINTSKLNRASNSFGGLELALHYKINWMGSSRRFRNFPIKCPH